MREYKLGNFSQLENLWLKFFHHPQGKWIMKLPEVTRLYESIKQYNPTQVLELGTGIGASTAIMASALDNGRIMTIEQSKKCIEIAKELIPFELKQKIQFEYAPATVLRPIIDVDPFQGWSVYLSFQWVDWDFVVIDGPGPFIVADKGKQFLVDLPNGDIIALLGKLKPDAKVFIQGRKQAISLYKRYLGWYLEVVEENEFYTLFNRTNKSLGKDLDDFENSDTLRGKLEESGYWK